MSETKPHILAVPVEPINNLLGEVAALLGAEGLVLFAVDTDGVSRVVYNGPAPTPDMPPSAVVCLEVYMALLGLGGKSTIDRAGFVPEAGAA